MQRDVGKAAENLLSVSAQEPFQLLGPKRSYGWRPR